MFKGFLLLALMATAASAQTVLFQDNFTFGAGIASSSYQLCAPITAWNGDANAYPQDMGEVCLAPSFIDVPFQLGFLNNGFLGCNAISFGPPVFTIGDGTHNGDAFTQIGSTTCPYYTGEYGGASDNELVVFSVVASYTVVATKRCYRGRCITYFSNVLQGGTGIIQETQIQ